MVDFNHSLNTEAYTWKNALLWGNCKKHFQEAGKGSFGNRIVHALIGLAELFPGVGQIASIAEKVIITKFGTPPTSARRSLSGRVLQRPSSSATAQAASSSTARAAQAGTEVLAPEKTPPPLSKKSLQQMNDALKREIEKALPRKDDMVTRMWARRAVVTEPEKRIIDNVLIGGEDALRRAHSGNVAGVTHIIIATSDDYKEGAVRPSITGEYKKVEVSKDSWEEFEEQFDALFEMIDQARSSGEPILIQDRYGKEESMTILLAYLINRCGVSYDNAFNYVNTKYLVGSLEERGLDKKLQAYADKMNASNEKTE